MEVGIAGAGGKAGRRRSSVQDPGSILIECDLQQRYKSDFCKVK